MPGSVLGIKQLLVYVDSLLVVQQVNKEWDINKYIIYVYVMEIRKLEYKFYGLEILHVIQDNNVGADLHSKLGYDRADVPPGVFVHKLHHPSIKKPDPMSINQAPQETSREIMMIEVDWRVSFIDFVKDQKLPPGIEEKSVEAERIIKRSKEYVLVGDKLYKHGSTTGVFMKCIPTNEGKEILQENHDGT
jgi:ornithine carbamoyltransferase